LAQRLHSESPLIDIPFSGDLCNDLDPNVPGTYTTGAACVLYCDLQLAAASTWVFKCDGGLTVAAVSKLTIAFADGISNSVVWTIDAGPVITGADSEMIGALTSGGAITLGAVSTWDGAMTSTGGAVNIGVGSIAKGNVKAFGAITLAASAKTEPGALESEEGAVDLGANSIVQGNVKARGAITLAANAEVESGTLESTMGAVTLGAGAETGAITAYGAITLAANANSGDLTSGDGVNTGTITLGANSSSGAKNAATITVGSGATRV
jgi:hypothetical protein